MTIATLAALLVLALALVVFIAAGFVVLDNLLHRDRKEKR